MLRLRTFGTAALYRDDRPAGGTATQRKRLAVLALLAEAGERGLTRDKLVAYLWPERDERARHILAQTIYAMRRELGGGSDGDDLFIGTDPIRLNGALISADVTEFDAALERGELERAVALYTGPFLDGLHLDSEEFEQWLDSARARLLGRQRDALTALARRAELAGDGVAAVGRWREITALDPVDGSAALALMHALAGVGAHAAAIQHARLYEALVRQQLGDEPDHRVTELARQLRSEQERIAAGGVAGAPTAPPPPAPPPPVQSPSRPSGVTAVKGRRSTPLRLPLATPPTTPPPPAPATPIPAAAHASPPPVRRRRLRAPTAALLVLVSLAISVGWWRAARRPGPAEPPAVGARGADRIAVLPFVVHGDATHAHLRSELADLLSTSLDGLEQTRGIDARDVLRLAPDSAYDPRHGRDLARRVGAAAFVLGDVTAESGLLRLHVALYDAAGEEPRLVAQASAHGAADSVFRLVDSVTARLLVARGEPDRGFARIAGDAPLAVLRDYLDGQRAFRDRRLADAIEAYRRALTTDSTFALAWYQLATVESWMSDADQSRLAAARAVATGARLPERERALNDALLAYVSGRADDAERIYRQRTAANVQDVTAWRGLGEVLFHYNWRHGRPFTESRAAWERVLLDDPNDWGALLHLSEIAARERKFVELESLVVRQTRVHPGELSLLPVRALDAYARNDRAARAQVLADVRRTTHLFPVIAAWNVAMELGDADGASEILRALIEPKRKPEVLAVVHVMQAQIALAHGRVRAARAELAAADSLHSALASRFDALALSAPFAPASRDELAAARARLARTSAEPHAPRGTTPSPWLDVHEGLDRLLDGYLTATLSLRLADRESAARLAGQIERLGATDDQRTLARALAASVRVELQGLGAAGADAGVDAGVDAPVPFPLSSASPYYALSLARFRRAQLLDSAGRAPDARRLYASFTENSLFDFVYAAPAHLASARILERIGSRADAAAEYRAFLALWSRADPELRPAVAEAERALARLGGS